MPVNEQRRGIITSTIAGAIGALLGSDRTHAASDEEPPDCSGLPADVSGTSTWLALRFVHQGNANASMLAPLLPGKKNTTVDEVLRYAIFCNGYKALAEHLYLGKAIKFEGAAAVVQQPEILFEDFKLENPDVDVPQRAKAEEAEMCRRFEAAGCTPEQVARNRILYGITRLPSPKKEVLWAFKFCGQSRGTAGFAIDATRTEHMTNAIATACIFRNLDEIRLWRLHNVAVDFLLGSPHSPGGWDLRYGCGFKKEELGGMPTHMPRQ